MWIVELSLEATPERLSARPEHRRHLTELHGQGVVRMAGPLADDTAAVVVLDVPDRPAVDAVLAGDPYFTTPGVTVGQIREWLPFVQ